MLLSHRDFSSVDTITDHLTEERETDFAMNLIVMLTFMIDDKDMVTGFFCCYIDILTQLDIAIGPEDETASITPRCKTVRRKPVDAEITVGTVIAEELAIAEVL